MPLNPLTETPNLFRASGLMRAAAGLLIAYFAACTPAFAESPLSEVAAPRPLPAEQAQLDKLRVALAPLLSAEPSPDDVKHLKEAVAAVRARDVDRFKDARSGISNPIGRKLADWIRLRAGLGDPEEYEAFLRDSPLWPSRAMLTRRLEEALFTQGGSSIAIKNHFATEPPQTGAGYAALASAYLAEGNTAKARSLAAKTWRDLTIPPTLETGFLARFGKLLTPADHKWRFDRLVTDDVRYAGNRADRVAAARRVIPLLPQSEQKSAKARLAVFNKASNARALMGSLSHRGANDPGLIFHRAQLLRKAGKIEEAADLILSVPPDPKKIAELDEWWAERRELAYGALKLGKMRLAYNLVKNAGPLTVNPLKEQAFMAGWIAFRYLNNINAAERHFRAMAAAADGPLSRAKAQYWLGRVADARGDKAAAVRHYRLAARNTDTFHGLLAMQMLQPGRTSLTITPPAYPTPREIQKLISLDASKALILAAKAKLSRLYTRSFLVALHNAMSSEAEAGMVAYIARAIGDPQMSLRIGKVAVAKGQNLLTYAYPVTAFPGYKPLRKPPELALLLGLARQETEFDSQIVSGAGAKGLLQIMPGTARHVCRGYKIKCQIPRLLSDTRYNVTLASAYIADRMDDFDGSYVLGLAGYNAGPGRARQWIAENGDPRDPRVDMVDWIERIPIRETRDYVTKVLANIQIYRARLGDTKNALRLQQDLLRARAGSPSRSDTRATAAGDSEG
ncbi:transglycosylase SLT domain-containing protein [Hyphomicrobium sp.]|jgi:soluble lytic murein transglycosylase|uniref:transglycosylase SLT domain-containing protein n=1 Tax=Hyphomicrobium sp. TaxID=82 RepID=UPI002B69A369|nr:transglycosylase SLT domain-containing protein [Hyphomicrobium sp.]HVZ04532.1 transglycosylase SLT domain-containing protein [Hyphomicrobium sp.]